MKALSASAVCSSVRQGHGIGGCQPYSPSGLACPQMTNAAVLLGLSYGAVRHSPRVQHVQEAHAGAHHDLQLAVPVEVHQRGGGVGVGLAGEGG